MAYWHDTRHPVPSLFFAVPLLIAYEYGVAAFGSAQAASVRNGADAMLRNALATLGFKGGLIAPLLIFSILFFWALRRRSDAPADAPAICMGMALESIAAALGLWMLSRFYAPLLDHFGVRLTAPPAPTSHATAGAAAVVTFLGAGVYEEVMFRLVLFSGLSRGLRLALLPAWLAEAVAAVAAAAAFAAVHHVGPSGEAIDGHVFVFRLLAGLYFTAIYRLRGLGIAVGGHACYDVLVGVAM